MPTLPDCFKSLINRPIELENEEPLRVIEILGENLGISDYKSNIAAFWFLDTLALQVLKYCINFDGQNRSIFVSWLAGAMKIIQEKNPSREDFFSEMNELFCSTAVKLVSSEPLLHWEILFPKKNQENADEGIEEILKQRNTKKTTRRRKEFNAQKEVRIDPEVPKEAEEIQDKNSPDILRTDPYDVLNSIVKSTFEMYGSISRYALIQAAFVDPVEIHSYVLPYNLKEPRKIKQSEFDNNIHTAIETNLNGSKTKGTKEKTKSGKSGKKKNLDVILSPPPPSMIDEEILLRKREYILPLIESYDAQEILRSNNN
ncbi:uncharacterized protein LOC117174896 isoform X2 [Belonocnema kinseyi]|nr:uncharacterized protein LOC117174896 isoform X2 [Belonocnema kinseyi]XP_033220216.1 uncharacterized protein LOC117174896 isoform X2 [Belonocnema kinseyi]